MYHLHRFPDQLHLLASKFRQEYYPVAAILKHHKSPTSLLLQDPELTRVSNISVIYKVFNAVTVYNKVGAHSSLSANTVTGVLPAN